MKEYRVRFNKRPGGPDDEAYFIELEDDRGKSLVGPTYPWKDEGNSVVLVLPTFEEQYELCKKTLSRYRRIQKHLINLIETLADV